MSSLYVLHGRDQGKRFELVDDVITIGRDASNTIRLRDTEVSRRHSEIRREHGGFVLVDLQSSNGSFVNQERISRERLKTGDRVQLGKTWLLFTQADTQTARTEGPRVDIVREELNSDPSRIVSTSRPRWRRTDHTPADETPQQWLEQAQQNLEVMIRTAQAVSHTLDIDELCERLIELIFEWVQADRACIMLLDPETDHLQVRATRQRDAGEHQRMAISQTILDYVLENREGVLTSNARDDERWQSGASIVRLGVREAICVPMQGRYGTVGVIYIDTSLPVAEMLESRREHRFRDDHLNLMIAIAQQAALAIEDTSYYSAMVQSERLAAIGHTVATLSHHIKNMLQGMKGGGFLIEEGLKQSDDEAVLRGWRMIERNQDKIANLVLDMLTFSKEREPELIEVDLNQTLGEIVELMHHRASEEQIELQWISDPTLPQLLLDPEGIHRAVLNLVTNAIDACKDQPEGRVRVSSHWLAEEGEAVIEVSDNGTGIDADQIDRIFRPFESTKGNRGTGLGLPATQKIIREHGGTIEVESQAGQGSVFRIRLPQCQVEGPQPAADDDPSATRQHAPETRS